MENRISGVVVDAAITVHRALGSGLLESAYEAALVHELRWRGLRVARQLPIAVIYRGLTLEGAFRADLIVGDRVLVELKALSAIAPVHGRQVLTYLRFAGVPVGLLLNFGAPRMKDGITRFVSQVDGREDGH